MLGTGLARISHGLSTAAADPGMSTALRSVGLLDVLLSTSAGPSVVRLVSMPVCAASLRNPVRNAGWWSGLIWSLLKHFYDNATCVQIDIGAVMASWHADVKQNGAAFVR